jgi:hypothetical protein
MISERFKQWMDTATGKRKKEVAKKAELSLQRLYHLGAGYRNASSEMAARIEAAADGELTRADLNETCANCPYYQNCQPANAVKK